MNKKIIFISLLVLSIFVFVIYNRFNQTKPPIINNTSGLNPTNTATVIPKNITITPEPTITDNQLQTELETIIVPNIDQDLKDLEKALQE